jgi:hypothetical protein
MNHWGIWAIPVLMVTDYLLTILGARASAKVYRQHFVLASYELNPLWRDSVDRTRWFNPRHMALVCVVTVALLIADRSEIPGWALELLIGALLGAWGMLCGRHLTNLLIFHFLNRHPETVSGRVTMSLPLSLKMSQFTIFGTVPLFILTACLAPHPATIGIALGIGILTGVHSIWARPHSEIRSPEIGNPEGPAS